MASGKREDPKGSRRNVAEKADREADRAGWREVKLWSFFLALGLIVVLSVVANWWVLVAGIPLILLCTLSLAVTARRKAKNESVLDALQDHEFHEVHEASRRP